MSDTSRVTSAGVSAREILALAIPALGALLVEPALLLVDSAVVGHWSTEGLAGLGLAQTILSTVVGLCVFLAYSTTAQAARSLGAGDLRAALGSGIDAIWLAGLLGAGVSVALGAGAGWILSWFGASPPVMAEAVAYLRVSALGIPAMLAIQAATGIIRGLQDTRTPLLVAVAGAVVNAPLSILLTLGLRWGVVGAATGTVLCQWGMAVALVGLVMKRARRESVPRRPQWSGVGRAWHEGAPLFVRTFMLRAAMVTMVVCVTRMGTVALAAHQVIQNIWGFFASGLDALAIAAQALIGLNLGAGQVDRVRATVRRMMVWAAGAGVVAAVVIGALTWATPWVFTPDVEVQATIRAVLVVVLIGQPLAGVVYVLDGVLMGAGDARYLARVGTMILIAYLPVIGAVAWWAPPGAVGLGWAWAVWSFWYMTLRAVTLGRRFMTDGWVRVGA